MKLSTIVKGATPVVAGLSVFFLAIRYMGDKPVLKDIKEGLKGNTVGLFK